MRMWKFPCLLLSFGFLNASDALADYVGNLVLLPNNCQSTALCTLGADFGFVDSLGVGWQADKGLLTDGASIPSWAQPIVGTPFESDFVKAAVIHDHYCNRRVRSWRATHRVFYEGLIASGVPKLKAGIMYFAVLIGGPKWVKLEKGKPCPVGMSCINTFQIGTSVTSGSFAVNESGDLLLVRSTKFDSPIVQKALEDEKPILESLGPDVDAAAIEAEAKRVMNNDFFFVNGDEVGTTIDVIVK